MLRRILVASLLTLSMVPWAAQGAEPDRTAAERAAHEYLTKLYRGTWNVASRGRDGRGREHLRVRSANLLRRWFGGRVDGDVWIGRDSEVARVALRPGVLGRLLTSGRFSIRDERTQTVVTTLFGAGVAILFGVPIDVALPLSSAFGAWALVKETRARTRLRTVADDLAERFASDDAPSPEPPPPKKNRARSMAAMAESVPMATLEAVSPSFDQSFDHAAEPPRKKGPTRKQLAREIRRSLGVE